MSGKVMLVQVRSSFIWLCQIMSCCHVTSGYFRLILDISGKDKIDHICSC